MPKEIASFQIILINSYFQSSPRLLYNKEIAEKKQKLEEEFGADINELKDKSDKQKIQIEQQETLIKNNNSKINQQDI